MMYHLTLVRKAIIKKILVSIRMWRKLLYRKRLKYAHSTAVPASSLAVEWLGLSASTVSLFQSLVGN